MFALPALVLKDEMTAADVPGWDSLTHIDLVLAIERRFKIKLTTGEVSKLKNVGDSARARAPQGQVGRAPPAVNFLSLQFALFLAITVPLFHLCPPRGRPLYLLVASYVFYALESPVAALGLLGATGFAYVVGIVLERTPEEEEARRRRILTGAVAVLLAYLFFFKALPLAAAWLGARPDAPPGLLALLRANLMLPLGISYYTFKLLSYVIDVAWGKMPAERGFVRLAAYAAFFPQIVAGPIQRPEPFLEQLREPRPIDPAKLAEGLRRILLGCFKKAVIADNLNAFMGLSYPHGQPPEFGTQLAFYVFPLQMFADFSALTDIAVGTALLFGLDSPENFNRPFAAPSISLYWRGWHMSLTTWLTDYVFLPLRMATRTAGNAGLAFSVIANMVLIGLWHNLSWTFLCFGLAHGVFLAADALTSKRRARFYATSPAWDRATTALGPIFTYHLVAVGMVFVSAESLAQAWGVFTHLFSAPQRAFGLTLQPETRYGFAGLLAYIAFEVLRDRGMLARLAAFRPARWALYAGVLGTIVKYGHNAESFIYYKF